MKRVLIISPETYPTVKVGGLGKVTAGLFRGMTDLNVDVKMVSANDNIYGPLNKKNTKKDNRVLGKRASRLCQEQSWQPDWVWCHDWGGIWSADEFRKYQKDSKIVWTVHSPISLDGYGYAYNHSYGGYVDGGESIDWGDDFFDFSALVKRGNEVSDKVTTVSRGYAKSLGRNKMFREKGLAGVGLGIDLEFWNPTKDSLVRRKLRSKNDWSSFKAVNKRELQELFGLPVVDSPVFAFVSRLVPQKGLDLLLDVLPEFLANNETQFVFVGDGRRDYKERLVNLAVKFGDRLSVKLEADFDLPHQVYAGADFLVLPSIEEPFGLVVAEAKRYGVVPIVHKTGGLSDQVTDGINGLSFDRHKTDELIAKLNQAMESWRVGFWRNKYGQLFDDVKGEVDMCRDFLAVLYGK